jgi:hypothetical protein
MPTTTPTSDLSTFLGSDPGLERLYDNVQSQVPAVGLAAVKMAAWNTVEDFYIRSTSRRETVYWQMAVGISMVDFNPFDETWLVAWVLSFCGIHRGKVVPPGELWDLDYPSGARKGTVLLALKPVSFDANLPPELWSTWFETILDGTLGRLYAQPAKPYTSPQLAQYHMNAFNAGVKRARDTAQRGNTDGPGRWAFPYFAGGRRKS